jgi:hypothetical protein
VVRLAVMLSLSRVTPRTLLVTYMCVVAKHLVAPEEMCACRAVRAAVVLAVGLLLPRRPLLALPETLCCILAQRVNARVVSFCWAPATLLVAGLETLFSVSVMAWVAVASE